jgi:predicted membrane channel-forming protein YqfA (hemolysin III family)
MDSAITSEFLKRLDALAAKLGTTGEHLWGVLLRQARIEAWSDLMLFVFALIVGCLSCFVFLKISERDDSNDFVPLAAICILLAIGALAFVVELPGAILTEFLNPEYWALKHILAGVK